MPIPEPLTSSQATLLLNQYGYNEIVTKGRNSFFTIFLHQFQNFLILLLLIAAGISFLLKDYVDCLLILVIVLLDTLLGFVQEYKAERALEKLQRVTVSYTEVIRDGNRILIENKFLVPGDIIILSEGNTVPADARLIEENNLEVDESLLTGESMPVYKHSKGIMPDIIYAGTGITKGHGKAVIEKTGMQTSYGTIAQTLSHIQKKKTPLEEKLTVLGRQLTYFAFGGGMLVFLLSLMHHTSLSVAVATSVSLIIAVVPEGLPAVITIALAVGVTKMIKRKVIVRKMAAIETLSAVSLIATDKTGTLTENTMKVSHVWVNMTDYPAHAFPKDILSSSVGKRLLDIVKECNNTEVIYEHASGLHSFSKDKTEEALIQFGDSLVDSRVDQRLERLDEYSFDSDTKTMSVVVAHPLGTFVLTKGAPENLLIKSTSILKKNRISVFTRKEKEVVENQYREYAAKGLRVLALCYKKVNKQPVTRSKAESGLTFVGLIAISDPVRKDIAATLDITHAGGIMTVMITGDNEVTAETIASEVHLLQKKEGIITGKALGELSDTQLDMLISSVTVYARCSPADKLRIIQAYQRKGFIVAVTGDGVNDVLALKQADVGIAMGKMGTDIAQGVSDIIITDDNFSSIAAGIEEGRIIFHNIVKSVSFLIIGNISEIMTILILALFGLPNPLLPLHILWINLVTDGLPAIALATDTHTGVVMSRPPRELHKNIISSQQFVRFFAIGSLMGIINVILYAVTREFFSYSIAQSVLFSSVIFIQLILVFLLRQSRKWYTNKLLVISVIFTTFSVYIILTNPFMRALFHFS